LGFGRQNGPGGDSLLGFGRQNGPGGDSLLGFGHQNGLGGDSSGFGHDLAHVVAVLKTRMQAWEPSWDQILWQWLYSRGDTGTQGRED
jgi:hypothetical protein